MLCWGSLTFSILMSVALIWFQAGCVNDLTGGDDDDHHKDHDDKGLSGLGFGGFLQILAILVQAVCGGIWGLIKCGRPKGTLDGTNINNNSRTIRGREQGDFDQRNIVHAS